LIGRGIAGVGSGAGVGVVAAVCYVAVGGVAMRITAAWYAVVVVVGVACTVDGGACSGIAIVDVDLCIVVGCGIAGVDADGVVCRRCWYGVADVGGDVATVCVYVCVCFVCACVCVCFFF